MHPVDEASIRSRIRALIKSSGYGAFKRAAYHSEISRAGLLAILRGHYAISSRVAVGLEEAGVMTAREILIAQAEEEIKKEKERRHGVDRR